jgi:ATP-dependent DNA helicase RecQ
MENIIYSGTKLTIDYYIDEVLDENRQEEIYDYFLNSETDSIEEAMANLSDYSEDDVRLMRIKFLSEYAN